MAIFRTIKNSLLGGQLSPTALGRTDLPQYHIGCKQLLNMIPMLSGGAYRRPGTVFVKTLPISGTGAPRLIPFVVSKNESYFLSFEMQVSGGNPTAIWLYTYRNTGNGFIRSLATMSGITEGSGGVVPYTIATSSTYNAKPFQYKFTVTSANATVAAVYTNNGYAYTVLKTISSGTILWLQGTGNPGVSGTLTKTSGTGDSTITFSANVNEGEVLNNFNSPDDEIWQVQYTQANDIMWLVHPNHKPIIVQRTAIDTFVASDFDAPIYTIDTATKFYPVLDQNVTSTTLQPSATTGTGVTLTASAALFTPNSIGSIYSIDQTTGVGSILITGFTSTTVVTGTVLNTFPTDGTAYTEWWESAWSPSRGWPRSVCLFQQRLCMGGTLHQPSKVWFSTTANYQQFTQLNNSAPSQVVLVNGVATAVTPAASYIKYPTDSSPGDGCTTGPTGAQPFSIGLSQNTEDTIQWLSPDKELLIGTLAQEWLISPQNGVFDIADSPTQIQSAYGSDYLPAVRIGYELIFPMSTQDELRAYQYNYIDASFFAEPIQLLFDQYPVREAGATTSVGRRKFRQFSWDVTRSTLWCLDTWGNFFGMTRDRKLGVTAWHPHQFGGYNSTQGSSQIGSGVNESIDPVYYQCDGSVTSFAVIPNPITGVQDIALVVKRTLPGTSVLNWQIEVMRGKNISRLSAYENLYPGFSAQEPFLVDAAIAQPDEGSAANLTYGGVISLASLYGYTPSGNYYSPTNGIFVLTGTAVDGSGQSTITSNLPPDYGSAANWVVFGLPFTSVVWPTSLDAGATIGTAQSAIKRISRVFVKFYKTMAALAGSPPTGNNLQANGSWTAEDLNPPTNVVFTNANQGMGQSAELFTGDKKIYTPTTYDRDGYLYLAQTDPLPFSVISIVCEGVEFDG